jgi:hypothetical protein
MAQIIGIERPLHQAQTTKRFGVFKGATIQQAGRRNDGRAALGGKPTKTRLPPIIDERR